ncbi:MAG: hypothetical protein EYC69_10000 [Bacteroidetes bacterium]|nr:MAG: hypothetical protein EYC69_10000 [Bacteroidota bacterium]
MKRALLFNLLIFLLMISSDVHAQCTCTATGTQSPASTLTPSTSWQSIALFGGYYTLFNVTSGTTYTWSFCASDGGSSSFDTRLNLFNNSGLTYIECSGDYSGCGLAAKIVWTATFTGVARLKTNVYYTANPCSTNAIPQSTSTLVYKSSSNCSIANITPTLLTPGVSSSPGPTISTLTPTLDWADVPGATSYGVYVRDMITTNFVINNNCLTNISSYTIPNGILTNGKTYQWYVQANVSCGSCLSLIPNPFYFSTCPILTTPTGFVASSTTNSITLSWNSVPNATVYSIYDCSNGSYISTTSTNSVTYSGLQPSSVYSLKVIALNGVCSSAFSNCQTISTQQSLCVTWVPNQPTDQYFLDAAEILCAAGIIDPVQGSQFTNNLKRTEVATILFNGLYGIGGSSPSDYFPTPFTDINSFSNQEQRAYKTMLYCQYADNETAFSRDFFALAGYRNITRGNAVKAIFEAWNIPASNSSVPYTDINANSENFKYISTAYSNGYLNNTSQSLCGSLPCFKPNDPITKYDFYVLLGNIIQSGFITPTPNLNSFLVPNNFTSTNTGNEAGIERAVFNEYSVSSFYIPGGGFSLEFSHSYHSNWTELPIASSEYLGLEWSKQIHNPLGIGWTHSYNLHIRKIFDQQTNSCIRLLIYWQDGTIHVYNTQTNSYETTGVTDSLKINTSNGNGVPTSIEIINKNGVKYSFGAINSNQDYDLFLFTITDRSNNSLTLSYVEGQQVDAWPVYLLDKVVDSFSGRELKFSYFNGGNFLSRVEDNSQRYISFTVNAVSKNLETYTDAKFQNTYYLYSSSGSHLLTRIQRPKGNFIDNTYLQNKLRTTSTNSYSTTVDFSPVYLLNSTATTTGLSVNSTTGNLTTHFEHNSNGTVSAILAPNGNTTIQYNDPLNPAKPTLILENHTGISTTISYEPNKRANPTSIVTSGGGQSISEYYTYNNFNQVTQYVNSENQTTTYTYDSNGKLTDVFQPGGKHIQNFYLANGLPDYSISPIGTITGFRYNAFGNLDSIWIQNAGISASATYDDVSRITSIRNPNGIQTQFVYDPNDNLLSERIDPNGLNLLTQRKYDANDNLISVVAPKGDSTVLTYAFNTDQLINETYGSYSKNWTYNTDGTINYFINKNGFTFQNSYYSAAGSLGGKLLSDGYRNYLYDNGTRYLLSSNRAGKQISYTYDGLGRVNTISYNDISLYNNSVTYEYHPNSNNLRYITYPQAPGFSQFKLEYIYDSVNRLRDVKNVNTGKVYVHYNYRLDDQLDSEVLGNGCTTQYFYDQSGRLDSIVTNNNSHQILASVGCTFDASGNHISESYEVIYSGQGIPFTKSFNDTTVNFDYNYMNRLILASSYSISSNNNGNITSNPSANSTYTWDERDRMLSSHTGGITTNYQYDPDENRRLKDSTRYILDLVLGSNVLAETDMSGNPQSIYVYGLGMVCRIDPVSGETHYYHYDLRGSTIAISDSSQRVVQKYNYEPFGELTLSVGDSNLYKNPFKYVGKFGVMHDNDQQYFMRARYYSPQLGRFISEDPVWGTNLFPYAGNNPIKYIDPTGDLEKVTWARIKEIPNQLLASTKEVFGLTKSLGGTIAKFEINLLLLRLPTTKSTPLPVKTGGAITDGSISISNWNGYPAGGIKPTGPFRLLEGAEYASARATANSTNAAMRRANPEMFEGLQIHEIHPVKFGGSPTELSNKLFLTPTEHIQYTNFWNALMRSIK